MFYSYLDQAGGKLTGLIFRGGIDGVWGKGMMKGGEGGGIGP